MKQSDKAAEGFQRLPRSDIPPDYKCPYPQCEFQGKAELSFRGHMATAHKIKYDRKESDDNPVKASLAKWERSKQELESLEHISQLASWHCALLAQHVVTGLPLGPMAKSIKHSSDTINAVARSPAGRAYMEAITKDLHDPIATARNLLRAGTVNKTLDWEYAWQLAVEAKDYNAIHKMAKEVGLHQVLESEQKAGPSKIVLNLNMGDLSTPVIASRFQVMEAEVVEEPAPE